MLYRRQLLQAAAAAGLTSTRAFAATATLPPTPVRTITHGPKHHWFGYYDKLQFDPSNRFVLSNQVDFEHRTPTEQDTIKVGMVDTAAGDKWVELGESRAWGWQQGCMLQWAPGSSGDVLWNDREGDRFVSRRMNVHSRKRKTLPRPLYALSPDGRFGLSADFARIQIMRPGYGYVGLPDVHADQLAPEEGGIHRVDLVTGESRLILSLAEIAKVPHEGEVLRDKWHYFNHLLVSPDSTRFIVLHRWRSRDKQTGRPRGGFSTRMFTASCDGGDLYPLNPSGRVSHFVWRDPRHVLMWTRPIGKPSGFYLFKDKSNKIEKFGHVSMNRNGHCTYLAGQENAWVLCDTYPGQNRLQRPYLYHLPSNRVVELGAFLSPSEYSGEWRCDTHPRSSNDGRTVCIDSPHSGEGRQMHLIDVSAIVDA